MLFDRHPLGFLELSNRIVMAPMTRSRAGPGEVIGAPGVEYYRQRASAGLIVSEGSQVSVQGRGYAWTPGIHSPPQVAGWRRVAEAVRAAGGRIFCQLWHVGRVSHPSLQPDGGLPVAPSALGAAVDVFTETGFRPMPVPRALDAGELDGIVAQFRHAAACAMRAGFDGVELHAAGGYLLDQFMRDGANRRDDGYGGSIDNRLRLVLAVADAVCAVTGPHRTGIRIAPLATHNGIHDSDPAALFGRLAAALNDLDLAYLHVIEASCPAPQQSFDLAILRCNFRGQYIACMDYDRARAEAALADGRADLIAFGRPFIANPDLVARLRHGLPLAVAAPQDYYGGGARGYIDWPAVT